MNAPIFDLHGLCLLVVEDEYLIASELVAALAAAGVDVVGPAATLRQAQALVAQEGERLDGALLDINLRDERVYPVADDLRARGVPFVFTTGYDQVIPTPYSQDPRCEKPVDKAKLGRLLAGMSASRGASS